MTETLIRVATPPEVRKLFVAGLVIVNDRCTEAAPILRRRCLGKSSDRLRALFKAAGWTATVVRMPP